jgi:rhamnogalacturonyl hydrolase YesR
VVAEVPRGHDPLWYAIDRRLLKQDYYNLGVALTFLSHLYRLTGNERFLSGALAYYGFLASCREDRLRSLSSGKVLYGLTWLYLATRDRQYLEEARVAADHLAESQADDGYWCQHGGPYLNITAEYAFELRWFIQVQKMLF